MKKIVAILMAVACLGCSLSGCGTKQTSSSKEEMNITFSFWEPGTNKEIEKSLRKIADTYEESHPGVSIELISQPVDGYAEWIKAQTVTDNLPDIQSNHANQIEAQYDAGYIVDISDAFNAVTPYSDGKIWKDTFIDGNLDYAHVNKYKPSFAVPIYGLGVAMFYNKTMYDKLGLSIPETWNELLANCEKIEQAGEMPIAFMAQKKDSISWLDWELEIGLLSEKVFANKNINYNGDCSIVSNEQTKAILEGNIDFSKDKELQDMFKLYIKHLKDYLKYCPEASGLDEAAAKTMFMSGTVGHIHSGSWDIQTFLKDDEIKFEVGAFPFPKFTKENSPYAGKNAVPASVQTLGITTHVEKQEGKKEAAIDFLQYLTSKEVYAQFINETMQVPVIKDTPADKAFVAFSRDGYSPLYLFRGGSSKEGMSTASIADLIISGQDVELTDEVFAEIQKSYLRDAKDNAEKKGWNKENNYGIDSLPMVGGEFKPIG